MATLFLDVTRLVRRYENFGGPTGLDRLEFFYLNWLRHQKTFQGRVVTGSGANLVMLSDTAVSELLATLQRRWSSNVPPQHRNGQSLLRFARERTTGRISRWRLLAGAQPMASSDRSVLLNVGHDGLHRASRYANAPGAFACLLSDIIPITHPEYETPAAEALHRSRIDTLAKHADHVFCVSAYTEAALTAELRDHRFATSVMPIGPALPPSPRKPPDRPRFVHLASLDRRKNAAMLLMTWRALIDKGNAPELILIGRRGNDQTANALLDRANALRPTVRYFGPLGDREAAETIAGSTALLTASFVEGFGMPIAEARALGVPVIASDIPAHREAGGPSTTYVDPTDGPGWIAAIENAVAGALPAPTPPPSWEDHFAAMAPQLADLAR